MRPVHHCLHWWRVVLHQEIHWFSTPHNFIQRQASQVLWCTPYCPTCEGLVSFPCLWRRPWHDHSTWASLPTQSRPIWLLSMFRWIPTRHYSKWNNPLTSSSFHTYFHTSEIICLSPVTERQGLSQNQDLSAPTGHQSTAPARLCPRVVNLDYVNQDPWVPYFIQIDLVTFLRYIFPLLEF